MLPGSAAHMQARIHDETTARFGAPADGVGHRVVKHGGLIAASAHCGIQITVAQRNNTVMNNIDDGASKRVCCVTVSRLLQQP